MSEIENRLSWVDILSDQTYEQSLAFYRLWFDVGHTYPQIPSDKVSDAIWNSRLSSVLDPERDGKLIHPTAHLILRFASDAESDHILAPHSAGLKSRLCARGLRQFFDGNLANVQYKENSYGRDSSVLWQFPADTNLIAHWANIGYIAETAIRNHILQSLISYPKLYDHQADALIILFKLAGATFGIYADPSVVNRCFELLKGHYGRDSYKGKLVQEVVELRERGWEGLPPPPVFAGIPKLTGANQNDPAVTPVVTSLGLPNRDPEPQVPQSLPLESTTSSEAGIIPGSPVTQSPSISIASLSDFTTADTSDDESPTDPTAITPHGTFYLEDGNVEVLCGTTLFRVHTSVLFFHSPTLRRTFTQASLATAESPNGCPRIPSSDTSADFATLLKMIYLPGFPERGKVPDFTTFSSLLRITTKYEMPTVQSQLLEVVRDAYPENFEGLDPSKALGESVFGGQTPHPNAVLNLFVQQKLTSVLPMAYYMAARRGLDSLIDTGVPASARLPPEILHIAIKGLTALREMELRETHRLVFGSKLSYFLSQTNCPSCGTEGPRALEAHQKVVDRIMDSSRSGTKVLEVLSLRDVCGGDLFGFCKGCVEGLEAGHAEMRKKAWTVLPDMFGLKA
ncbi:hypothetical protein BDM02DRAFT_3189170 [Thelephora ganbajun]|uniref:Uncharacterized protein n=1 Tax=Thelephora ganbajun TaxID=370292 RepID=A0ACB6Z8U4_THEGA|nr:hypothetical protein BDM02DRAFT_3189170 [Thelephora ganbajun]